MVPQRELVLYYRKTKGVSSLTEKFERGEISEKTLRQEMKDRKGRTNLWTSWIYSADRQQRINLSEFSNVSGTISWSNDESKVAFRDRKHGLVVVSFNIGDKTSEGFDVYEISPNGYQPSWSPASQNVLFVNMRDNGSIIVSCDIYLFELNNQRQTNLTNSPEVTERYPVWSNTNEFIYTKENKTSDIVKVILTEE